MAAGVEKDGHVTAVIESRPEVRSAMHPDSANALLGWPVA